MNEIDSLKKRVADLERANRELDDIFNAMGDIIFVIDKNNVITKANNSAASLFKTKPQNMIGMKCHDLVHKLGKPWPGCPFEKTKEDKNPHTEEVNDPNIGMPLLVTASPIFNDSGEMVGAVHIAKNIAEYKKQEKALRESEIKYKTIFESSADAIMLTVPEKGFIAGNEATVKIFGCKDEEEFIAQSPASLSPQIQPDGQPSPAKAQKMMQIAMEKGANFFEWTHRRMNGEEFFATVLLTKMNFGGQAILQATVRDITERVLSEKQLAKKLRDFEIFYKAAIDREMKIKELKKKVSELEAKMRS
ncbi:MAG: PAS domain-containing protein [Candidatus Omnitrophica bacterium]|nr:PAS domain-containing protein [Candidatus Omnitrophota bacterium]